MLRRYTADEIRALELKGVERSALWEILWGFRMGGHDSAADIALVRETVRKWEETNNTKWRADDE